MKRMVAALVSMVAVGTLFANLRAADDDKPKYTIKDVMKFHQKDKLHEKFQKGETTKEEKQKLLDGYESMLKVKPPAGDEKDWKTKVESLVKTVKDDDKDGFKKAVNCMACHGAHKPKK